MNCDVIRETANQEPARKATQVGAARFLALLLALLALSPGWQRVSADEDRLSSGLDEAVEKRLRGKLRSRAAGWWRHRKRMVMVCPQCKGRGSVPWRRGRQRTMVKCPKCEGNKIFVDKDPYRHCFYDMRSPAFRLQPGIQDRVTKEFVAARDGHPFPARLLRYATKDIDIIDATHGIVHVERNKEGIARPQRWVWAEEGGKSPTWYLWDEEADGPWPDPGAPESEVAPEEALPVRPVPAPLPIRPSAPEPESEPPQPAPDEDRVTLKDSTELLKTWTKERNHTKARVIRIRLGLDDIEGKEQKVADARTFLAEIDEWMNEAKPFYDQAKEDVEVRAVGVRLSDRLKINTLHFKAHRRLDLVEKMVRFDIHGLTD